ncbi:penicillin-binding protein 1B [Paraferrimonas haliotis]|uniref:penicillin-binding protein 1B n=1 Tax=Paraferrimonas haliotis TaxID=2013866 RepID=UPI000BA981CB|nr:penicillin-binding protein 1B [Paraferrimonas haliotis]
MTKNITKKRPSKKSKAKSTKRHWGKSLLSLLLKLSLIGVAILVAWGIYLDSQIAQKFSGQQWHLPAQVFSRSLALYPDAPVSHGQTIAELNMLGYRKVANPRRVGEYSASQDKVEVWRRGFQNANGWQHEQRLLISFDARGVAEVQRLSDNRQLAIAYLEPVLLDRMVTQDREDRVFVPRERIPQPLVEALLLIEDRDFYQHHGVNPSAIARAAVVNVKAGRTVQGGSTITQQLAKNFFLSSERSLWRKVREAYMALIIDFRYSKEAILEAYLNEVYMGQDRARGVHGMGLAAQFYFGRPLTELTTSQQALLIALIKGPSYYNPWRYGERAASRRDLVLRVLLEHDKLTTEEYKLAVNQPLQLRDRDRRVRQSLPAFFSLVRQELSARYGNRLANASGIKVYTTLDPLAQKAAEQAVVAEMARIKARTKKSDLQVGMVVTDRYQGGVAAMIGDANPNFAGFNRALDIRRPIGSLVKPFVYATALSNPSYNLATPLKDEAISLSNGQGKTWQPKNVDKQFKGQVPLLDALVGSRNVPTVNLGMEVGLNSVAATLHQSGWRQDVSIYPSMLLGAIDGSPMMAAQIFHTLADGGRYRPLTSITAVLDNDNQLIEADHRRATQAIDPQTAYLVEYALKEVVKRGTAKALGANFPSYVLAGKTGTSNDNRDSWFAGYDQNNVAAVWVGLDNNDTTGLYGSSGAMGVYQSFLKNRRPMSLRSTPPQGIVTGYFDPATGQAQQKECNATIARPAMKSSWQPTANCSHGSKSWWNSLFE